MNGIPGYARIAFVASATAERRRRGAPLAQRYGGTDPADADVIVALGGERVQCCNPAHLHEFRQPIYGNCIAHRRLMRRIRLTASRERSPERETT